MSVDPDQRAKTYVAVLKHANLDVDWKAFASELGISTPGNAYVNSPELALHVTDQCCSGSGNSKTP